MQDKTQGLPKLGSSVGSSSYFEPFLNEEFSVFFFRGEERTTIQQQFKTKFQQEYGATLETAESLIKHSFHLFGKSLELGEKISWQVDPLTQNQWPNEFYAGIDTRDGKTTGGVKWVWELNRHHHFVTLGKAYFLSGDERFAQELLKQWQAWIEENPPLQGINWTSSLELALRLINWSWALAFVRCSSALTDVLFSQIMQSIAEQAIYISRHRSAHSSANNHLIGEVAGLAVVALCFPWLPHSVEWRDTSLNTLKLELERQISTDGVPAEQAISYLGFVLDFNLIVWQLAQLNGFDTPEIWHDRLSAACDFICHIMDNAGNIPAFGDSDDAWVVRLDDRRQPNNYCSILVTAAAILHRSDLKSCAGCWDEKSQWLLGDTGRHSFEELPAGPLQPSSRIFKEGGYAAFRSPNSVIVSDFGPLGYLSTAAHGHADALSITAAVNGLPLLIDPGTYAYQEGGAWRDYFRSTAAHNTIVVDGRSQSEIKGTFLWGHKANASLLFSQLGTNEDRLLAEHDGYANFGTILRRVVIFCKPDWLLIGDELRGTGAHQIEQFWHIHPAWQVEIKDNRALLSRQNYELEAFFTNTSDSMITTHRGETDPIRGWYSSQYGQKEPATTIRIAAVFDLPTRFSTIIALNSNLELGAQSDIITNLLRLLDNAWEQR